MTEQNANGGQDTQQKGTSVRAHILYNNNYGALELGFWQDKAFFSLSPVFKEHAGKEPQKGLQMYNHDAKVFFQVDLGDVKGIQQGLTWIKDPETSGVQSFAIAHPGRNGKKVLIIGNDMAIDDETELAPNEIGLWYLALKEYDADGKIKADNIYILPEEALHRVITLNPDDDGHSDHTHKFNHELDTLESFLQAAERVCNKEHLLSAGPAPAGGNQPRREATESVQGGGQRRRRRELPGAPAVGGKSPVTKVAEGEIDNLFDSEG
jgi:hypothetical protein